MTEQAPNPAEQPINPFTQEQAQEHDISQVLAERLAAADEAQARGEEVPADLRNELAGWADSVESERGELISAGRDLGGGVEIPDTYAMHYKVNWLRHDDTPVTEPIDKNLALRIMAYKGTGQPVAAETSAATNEGNEESPEEKAHTHLTRMSDRLAKIKDGTASERDEKFFKIDAGGLRPVKDDKNRTIGYTVKFGPRDNKTEVTLAPSDPLFEQAKVLKQEAWRLSHPEEAKAQDEANAAKAAKAAADAARPKPGGTSTAESTTSTTEPEDTESAPADTTASATSAPKQAATALKKSLELDNPDDDDFKTLVKIDAAGRPRHAKGNGRLSGKFMKTEHAEKLEEMKDLIMANLDERKAEYDANEAAKAAEPTPEPTPTPTPSTPASETAPARELSDREHFIQGLRRSRAITYKVYGDRSSGRASDKEIQKRIDYQIYEFDKRDYRYNEAEGKYVARNPEKERVPLRQRIAAKLGGAATKAVIKPLREVATQTRQFATVKVNTTPGLKHAANAADRAQDASIERQRRRQSRLDNPVHHASATRTRSQDRPVRLNRPDILDRLDREEQRRRTTAKKRG